MTTDTETITAPCSPADLYRKLMENEPLYILDVRSPEVVARMRIEGKTGVTRQEIPYYEFMEDEENASAPVPTDREVLVVCNRQNSSELVVEMLRNRGLDVRSLEGGMAKWSSFYDVRDVINESFGRIVQVARPARGDLSFIVISNGEAAIIDPLRHIEQYTNVINEAGAKLTHILDTHAHADHISGGAALAQETGATYYLHPYDAIHPMDMLPAKIAYTPLADGQRYQVGQFTVEVIGFPGHTLGQVNFLFTAPDTSTYLFTGDGIFLRSFGRPDLGGRGEAWTPILYESMFERLPRHINNDTLILPAHFSSLDEADDQGRFVASYGKVRQENDGLIPRSLQEFTEYVLSHLPEFPPQYVEIKRVNIGLVVPDEEQAEELEVGKNVCALSE